ncbi:uncharacterized protein LOC123866211 [Maniola jurtina]|uniref:uncharacterized protein LOC123866211 n=1 Tax=Maniola jurtina TaxID=191418 RepID=UPI001E68C672|nr:uncharacterized protein LOC123866211 [Maniola jurtina]XP_045763588.1 uncharacterized protein LOC123866211 [Maniola jurtina]
MPVLLLALIAKCRCEATNGYNSYNTNDASHFGQLLKPPPPPPLPILPVPFNAGLGKLQNQNDFGYQYQSPPPLPSTTPPVLPLKDFKFPAPFYRQYSFNFVPPPQPFTTTPSPSMFQKISGWLFPSQQISSDLQSQVNNNHNTAPLKGNCNPCNLVPWIPVIRYDLAPNNGRQNAQPTYGPPSPTTTTNFNSVQNLPQPFAPSQNNNYNPPIKLSTGIPHASYGPPSASQSSSSSFNPPSSTYGPPSPTHVVSTSNQAPLNSPYSISSSSFYDIPNTSLGPSSSYGLPSSPYRVPDSTYKSPLSSYGTPSIAYENHFSSTTHSPISTGYKPELLNHYLPTQNDVELLSELEPSSELQLPRVTHPTGFRNSYGEPILNTYALDIPFSVSAAGAASSKIKTEILPENRVKPHGPNMTIELANPAPFSLNRGRNIHTLQPVALPNLSVSPLPPIFNARPFRVITSTYPFNNAPNNFNIAKSVPVAEYTQSVEYPATIIQSPVIDIDELKTFNHTKGYRNIQNSFVIDGIRDISPQASEDHISAAKSNQDVSFESIGNDFTNDLYDGNIPMDLKQPSNVPFNHKVSFADLRGVKDEDVDKYRTESNLQHIDSPLLYLKPSAPHKNYNNFFFMVTTPGKQQEYEIYDDIPTTTESTQATLTSGWDESRNYFTEHSSSPIEEEKDTNRPKIVQIIVPYTTAQRSDRNRDNFNAHQEDSISSAEQKYQARKIQSNTENIFVTIATEGYSTLKTTTEEPLPANTENYDLDRQKSPMDFYDVKEPPFDIVKLQHTIDDWTEQEYSKDYSTPQRTRSSGKYAKQIPDEFLTTISPFTHNYPTDMNYYNFDLYDHEGASSMHHIVTDNKTDFNSIKRKEYNTIERLKSNYNSGKNEEAEDIKKLHIYTAASTFRSTTTTTPAPWGQIQTSISPLTNEKIYVVTSKPWREKNASREYDYEINQLESNDTSSDNDDSEFDNLPFKSPRFTNRPSYGFTADALESIKLDSPYGFSRGWHRRINNLEYPTSADNESLEEDFEKDSKSQRRRK